MSIKNCQATQKSFIDRKRYFWFTWAQRTRAWFVVLRYFLGRLRVNVFKTLNGRESDAFGIRPYRAKSAKTAEICQKYRAAAVI